MRNLLDFVVKCPDGYMLSRKLPRKTFAQLCKAMGQHGYRYAGRGLFRTAKSRKDSVEVLK